jgi:transposase-like protein
MPESVFSVFFVFAPAFRKIIYTTNAIESLHSEVRKAVRGHGHFPSDKAARLISGAAERRS